jgi:hypothetical protein
MTVRRPTTMLLVTLLLLGLASVAAAGDMALTRSGKLYRVAATPEGITVTDSSAGDDAVQLVVPQTTGVVAASLQVGNDDATGAVYVAWQEGEGVLATVKLAAYADGTWFGPVTLAGGDGMAAASPQLLVFHYRTPVTAEDDTTQVEEDTFLHLVWWGFTSVEEDGSAFYVGVPVDEYGLPVFDDFAPRPVTDLLPFGIACSQITNAAELAHPMLFVDPQSGNPHLLATDFGQCLFQLVELQCVEEGGDDAVQRDDAVVDKRRRRVVIFGRTKVMPVSRQLPLEDAKVAVGHDLSVVMYWEQPDEVSYIRLDKEGSSPLLSLAVGDDLSMDRAVELIRTLTR